MSTLKKKTIADVDLKAKRVLARVDFNVPLDGRTVKDDTRIRAALPTINTILDAGSSLVLMSHLGRPKGEKNPAFSLAPVAAHLSTLLGRSVQMAPDCIGDDVEKIAAMLKPGEVLLLENVRFHAGETKGDEGFARKLAQLGEVFVNDAFGTAHRAHASTTVVAQFLKPAVAGLLLQKELDYFERVLGQPARPLVALLGGAKVSDKIKVIDHLLDTVDELLIGGAMAYTFLKAQAIPVGNSLVEDDQLDTARAAIAKAKEKKISLRLPVDHIAGDDFSAEATVKTFGAEGLEDGWMGLDIGSQTTAIYAESITNAKTVVWNGPMGVFEWKAFAEGTLGVARALAASEAISVIGGGDSVRAVNESGLADKMSHISTGGGASLELMEGKVLPGVAALDD